MSTSQMKRPGFLYSDKDHCIAICSNVILSFSLQPPNPAYLKAWIRATDRLVEASSGPIAICTIIDSNSRTPDEASRREIKATVSKHALRTCAFAYIVEGHGFGAAAMRSVLSLISLTARYPFPQKVFANAAEGAVWLSQRTQGTQSKGSANVSAKDVVNTVEAMRHQVKHLAAAG